MEKVKDRKIYFGFIVYIIVFMLSCIRVQAEENPVTGLEVMDKKEFQEFIDGLPQIEKVHLNEEGVRAIYDYEKANNIKIQVLESVKKGEEIETAEDTESVGYISRGIEQNVNSLPESYDVSKKTTFPPIGDQGSSGSCTSWAMGYYQMTNNLANIRGLDAKNNQKYRISPAWLHNLAKIKDGANRGSALNTAAIIMLKQGVPYWTDFDGTTTADNYSSWNPDATVWEKALSNRMGKCCKMSISEIDEKTGEPTGDIDLTELKKLLLDGYVVSFASYFKKDMFSADESKKGWEMSNKCIKYPSQYRNDWIMLATYYDSNNGENSGHAMTIVGWDDTIAIDYDGDGKPDTEGALKIANSWGKNWHNEGFYWMAYDALLEKSTINHNPDRAAAIDDNLVFYMEPRKSYMPLLVAEITMETNSRRELTLSFGISNANTVTSEISIPALKSSVLASSERNVPFWNKNLNSCEIVDNHKINYDFYGQTPLASQRTRATFVLDLTDLLSLYQQHLQGEKRNLQNEFQKLRLYFKISDAEKDGYSSALKNIVIRDKIAGRSIGKAVNLVVDGTSKEVYIDYNMDTTIVDENKNFLMTFNYPIRQTSIDNDITVNDYQQDNITTYYPTMTYTSTRQRFKLSPINGGYEAGHYYSLNINVKSEGGNSLTNQSKYYFYRLKEAS